MTTEQLLDALHLWLHREGGDRDLAAACASHDWTRVNFTTLHGAERHALNTLYDWHRGFGCDLIGACEDFHEAWTAEACTAVDEQVVRLDGKVAPGWGDIYEADNVIPLRRL